MATVKHFPDGRMTIRMSIAEPMGVLATPLCIVPLGAGMMSFMVVSNLLEGKIEAAKALPALGILLPALLISVPVLMAMFNQTWEFSRTAGQIRVKRGILTVRTEPLKGLVSARYDARRDEDGESGQAVLCYVDGREILVNRIPTGSIGHLKTFVKAINEFLEKDRIASPGLGH